jgi:alkylhydroperoxidase family enzyme
MASSNPRADEGAAAEPLDLPALIPDHFERYFAFFRPGHREGILPCRIKELARLKIAALNQCDTWLFARYASATRQGLDEETIRQIHLPEAERALAPRDALAVRFAERLATDFRTADAAFLAELRAQFSDAEIAELGMMIGQYISLGRLLVIAGGHKAMCELYVPDY